jgi:hypothetical protein
MDGFALLVWFGPPRLNLWPGEELGVFPAMKAEVGQSECRQSSALAVRQAAVGGVLRRLLKTDWQQSEPVHDALRSRARLAGSRLSPKETSGSTAPGRESPLTMFVITESLT